jgi:hypothetical protein
MRTRNILIKGINKPMAILLLVSSHIPIIFILTLLALLRLGPSDSEIFVGAYFLLGFSAMASLMVGFTYYTKSIWTDGTLSVRRKVPRFCVLYFIMPVGVLLLYWDEVSRKWSNRS